MKNPAKISRKEMIALLNEDLAREFQAVIAYVVYSQTMKGAKFQSIAGELKKHASEELDHAIQIAKQIDYFNGTPVTVPKPVKMSDKPEDMLRFDLQNEADDAVRVETMFRHEPGCPDAHRTGGDHPEREEGHLREAWLER